MKKNLSSSLKGVNDVLHRICLSLYPNHLAGGRYHARTINERALTREQVCESLKTRGGFTGNYRELLENIKQYYDEVVYLLCDGYAVNSGFYTIFPNIGGTFNSPDDAVDPKKHPLTYRLRASREFKELAKNSEFKITGVASTNGYIRQFYDVFSDTCNDALSGGDNFIITGDKIKIMGEDDDECGVYFEPADGSGTRIKVEKRLTRNMPSELIGTAPALAPMSYRVVVVTRYASGGTLLKEPRTITGEFELDVT